MPVLVMRCSAGWVALGVNRPEDRGSGEAEVPELRLQTVVVGRVPRLRSGATSRGVGEAQGVEDVL